jgi:hypothetical protein
LGGVTVCLSSRPDQNLVYYNSANVPPAVDSNGLNWAQAGYTTDSDWTTPVSVTAPPPEWIMSCGPEWISTLASALPPTLADTYYRNSFVLSALPAGLSANLTFSMDDGGEIWLNGTKLATYTPSFSNPAPTFMVCTTLSIPATLFQTGVNTLGFRVLNIMTYEGVNYTMCLTTPCGNAPTGSMTVAPSLTTTASPTPTSSFTFIKTASSTATNTATNTATGTPTNTKTSTPSNTPTSSNSVTGTFTFTYTGSPTITPTPVYTEPVSVSPTPIISTTPCLGGVTVCLSSRPEQNLVYFNSANVPPAVDAKDLDWAQPGYNVSSGWTTAVSVSAPPPEWIMSCGPAWISSLASGYPPTLADTYYRNTFALPAPPVGPSVNLTFSMDEGGEVWLNGVKVGTYPSSLSNPAPYFMVCTTLSIPATLFQTGLNTLAFRVQNLMTYEGLNYTMCLTTACGNAPTAIPTATNTWTATRTYTPTNTWTPTFTWTNTFTSTPTPTDTPIPSPVYTAPASPTQCSGGATLCLNSEPAQNLIYFNSANVPPTVDANGFNWAQAGYGPNASWVTPVVVTAPPPEWTMACGPVWISTLASGLPPTMADTYYRNTFTLPGLASDTPASLTFSVDDGVEIWLNGVKLAYYPGSLTSPDATRNYHICNTLQIPATFFHPGVNTLGFRVENLMTYEGLSYSLCLATTCAPSASPTVVSTKSASSTPTFTPTTNQGWSQATSTPTPERTCHPVPYPNPCNGGDIHFHCDGGPYDKVLVKIYTTGFRNVCHVEHVCHGQDAEDVDWDLKDDCARLVSNGLYYAVIETHCNNKINRYTEKVLILR